MLIDRHRQSAEDKLRYTVDMTRWLGANETVEQVRRIDTQVDVFLTEEIVVVPTNPKRFTFLASGGRPGVIFPVRLLVTTSLDQQKTITIEFSIGRPRGSPMLPPGSVPPPVPPGNGGSLDVGVFTPGDNTGNCPV
jgi:hypothetical protein